LFELQWKNQFLDLVCCSFLCAFLISATIFVELPRSSLWPILISWTADFLTWVSSSRIRSSRPFLRSASQLYFALSFYPGRSSSPFPRLRSEQGWASVPMEGVVILVGFVCKCAGSFFSSRFGRASCPNCCRRGGLQSFLCKNIFLLRMDPSASQCSPPFGPTLKFSCRSLTFSSAVERGSPRCSSSFSPAPVRLSHVVFPSACRSPSAPLPPAQEIFRCHTPI
jgi:hypothetical protein